MIPSIVASTQMDYSALVVSSYCCQLMLLWLDSVQSFSSYLPLKSCLCKMVWQLGEGLVSSAVAEIHQEYQFGTFGFVLTCNIQFHFGEFSAVSTIIDQREEISRQVEHYIYTSGVLPSLPVIIFWLQLEVVLELFILTTDVLVSCNQPSLWTWLLCVWLN